MRRSLATLAALLWGAASAPADGPPPKSGLDRQFVNPSVRAQDDLYRHINGKWLDEAQIPADRSMDGAFYKLRDQAEADLRAIIEESAKTDAPAGSEARKVGDLFASYTDEAQADRLGLDPIKEDLAVVERIKDIPGVVRAFGMLGRLGVDTPIGMNVDTDARQSDRYIIYVSQGGLGLPDESYYRVDKFAEIRDAYRKHIAATFALMQVKDPQVMADRVFALETRLAKDHWDRVRSRDDTQTYNKKDRAELARLTPGFDWDAVFEATGVSGVGAVVVRQPSYFAALAQAAAEAPVDQWQAYLTWCVARTFAPLLSKPIVDENFAFYGKALTGTPELRPRWKRAVGAVEGAMGEAVGKLYVARHFPPAAKARMEQLVANLIRAYEVDIRGLPWMSAETKRRALEKLAKFTPKIGYPDKWRDYATLEIRRDDLVGNMKRAAAFETARQLAKLGKPVDRAEWLMTPQTVNAYYNPGMNEIVFPAAILQPPFFDLAADDAVNYGGIGAVIGHEIGHGFDDQGSKYDGDGNLNDWWTADDRREFEARAERLIAQYNNFEPAQAPGQHVNGALTIGENIGDLGGLTIALKAYAIALDGAEAPKLDGLTGEQRLFIGWAQVWRSKARTAELVRRLAVDPHSPTEFRCNGVVRNIPEFYRAFGVKEGDKLYLAPEARVTIW